MRFQTGSSTSMKIEILNIMGQKVRTLSTVIQSPGRFCISWDGTDEFCSNVGTGIYLYQISAGSFGQAGDFTQTRKMLLLK